MAQSLASEKVVIATLEDVRLDVVENMDSYCP